VTCRMRAGRAAATLLRMHGATLLLTGFPAAGKMALASTLTDPLRPLDRRVEPNDEDAIRPERAAAERVRHGWLSIGSTVTTQTHTRRGPNQF